MDDELPTGEPRPRGPEPVRAEPPKSSLEPSTSPPDSPGLASPPGLAADPESGSEPSTAHPDGPGLASGGQPSPVSGVVSEGQPEPAGVTWCAQCAANVVPTIPNHCPVCGGWVFDNNASVVHGLRSKKLAKQVDAYRVSLIDQLFAERGGRDALDVAGRIAVENYALVCAQHKTIEARLDQDGLFTQTGRRRSAFDMLKGISETIDRLRAALPPIPARTTDELTGIEKMPMSALELASDLLKRLRAGLKAGLAAREVLSDFERGQLDVLDRAMRGELLLRGEFVAADPPRVTLDDPAPPTVHPPVQDTASTAVQARPEPEPACPYCHQSYARCAEMKADRHPTWRDLHYNDPEERKKRDEYATAVMLKMMRYGHY